MLVWVNGKNKFYLLDKEQFFIAFLVKLINT
jgi:hypothetical protein